MPQKRCFRCGEPKELTEFYKHPGMADGRVNKCKACNKADVRANYRENVDHYKAYDQARAMRPDRIEMRAKYQSTPEGKAALRRAHEASETRYPERKAAVVAVGNAIRDGKLIRQPCEKCGERAQAHHDDYSKPLEVRWLCPSHHREHHRNHIKPL